MVLLGTQCKTVPDESKTTNRVLVLLPGSGFGVRQSGRVCVDVGWPSGHWFHDVGLRVDDDPEKRSMLLRVSATHPWDWRSWIRSSIKGSG